MLIARSPLRISFGGGGTDLPAYADRYGGMVFSTSIDKYCYAMLTPNHPGAVQLIARNFGSFCRLRGNGSHNHPRELALARAVIARFGGVSGLNVSYGCDLPPGTGLGSSSAITVALVLALGAAYGRHLGAAELAEMACHIEIEDMGMPIGRQDQYASAFGSLNVIEFGARGVRVRPVYLDPKVQIGLAQHLMLFYTGVSRRSSDILREQGRASEGDAAVVRRLHAIKELAGAMVAALERGDIAGFGALLDRSWQEKRCITRRISNSRIDDLYVLAREMGALGGKIAGAGGGGFLLLCVPPDRQEALGAALEEQGLRQLDFTFDHDGARVLVNNLAVRGRRGAEAEVVRCLTA